MDLMDNSGLGGGFLSGPNGGLFDLESSVHRQQQPQLSQPSMIPHNHMVMITGLEKEHRSIGLMDANDSNPNKGFSMNFGKGKGVSPTIAMTSGSMSEEDELSYNEDGNGENSNGGKSKKGSPWQRMKWTDNVVSLLIAVVACVGDDGMIEGRVEGLKRKSEVLQKKGKWKTLSKIMISKGFHVSPQQCEDKFNDLNKRYKKLNDVLGRGTSCRVVENPSLMESMPHLSAKAKEDVKKILNSKHLFYQEMCAYHNGQRIPNCQDLDLQGCSIPLERCLKDNNGSDEEGAEGSEDDNKDDNTTVCEEEKISELHERKKVSAEDGHFCSQSAGQDSFKAEMAGVFQDPTRSSLERKKWIKRQMLQLQEERVNLEAEAFELEKQRFKWLRYCNKKDRELERLRLENERMRLENEQSVLHLRKKELEAGYRRSDASLDPTSLGIDRLQGRDQIDIDRHQ